MKLYARAKINLSLDVTGIREDGYHLVKMVMQNVDVYDILTLERTEASGISITTDAPHIPTDQRNLIWKAAAQVLERYPMKCGLKVHLQKRIPSAAGLAGGSADAAAVIRGMNELFALGMTMDEMCRIGVRIGADVPYCILGGTALAEGIGEVLTVLPAMPDCRIILAKPDLDVSTKGVYTRLDACGDYEHPEVDAQIAGLREGSLDRIVRTMGNVLERVTIPEHPEVQNIKNFLTQQGADGAMMSGSGPTVFGIFREAAAAKQAFAELQKSGLAKELFLTRPCEGWE